MLYVVSYPDRIFLSPSDNEENLVSCDYEHAWWAALAPVCIGVYLSNAYTLYDTVVLQVEGQPNYSFLIGVPGSQTDNV